MMPIMLFAQISSWCHHCLMYVKPILLSFKMKHNEKWHQNQKKIFSIAAVVQSRTNNFSNHSKAKYCEHCNRWGYTIENCWTLTFYCKYSDKNEHTEENFRYKNGTWVLNNTRTQNNRQNQSQQQQGGPRSNAHNGFPAANATNSYQSTQETYPRDVNTNLSNSLYGLFK